MVSTRFEKNGEHVTLYTCLIGNSAHYLHVSEEMMNMVTICLRRNSEHCTLCTRLIENGKLSTYLPDRMANTLTICLRRNGEHCNHFPKRKCYGVSTSFVGDSEHYTCLPTKTNGEHNNHLFQIKW